MKKLFLFVAISLLAFAAKSQQFTNSSEFFLEVSDRGAFTVSIDGESASSQSGRFRFFDLHPGRNSLIIELGNKTLYRGFVMLTPGTRNISSFSAYGKLRLIASKSIYRNGQYALDNWNGDLYYDRHDSGRPSRYSGREMSPASFSRFLDEVKKEPFEDGRQKLIRIALRDNSISVDQLTQLLKQFSFDDRKLEVALDAYASIANPSSFYLVRNEFSFISSREKFDKFLEGR
ncbi:MAG: hypothetical protein K0S09_2469 [Sphingobacteriaceae bacterium]|jgi:hypothetical protein|nr:hypothetical protein [Sphingobacteriaceae bacterium]